ncbi:MAG TPA: DUF3040 domain-containing protein [Kineosporiaceae bacterium]
MRSLDPDEERILRRLEEQVSEDDPRLSAQMQAMRPSPLVRLAPTAWRPGVFAAIGVVLLVAGLVASDGSAVLGGLLACGLAWLRASSRRPGTSSCRPGSRRPGRTSGRSGEPGSGSFR